MTGRREALRSWVLLFKEEACRLLDMTCLCWVQYRAHRRSSMGVSWVKWGRHSSKTHSFPPCVCHRSISLEPKRRPDIHFNTVTTFLGTNLCPLATQISTCAPHALHVDGATREDLKSTWMRPFWVLLGIQRFRGQRSGVTWENFWPVFYSPSVSLKSTSAFSMSCHGWWEGFLKTTVASDLAPSSSFLCLPAVLRLHWSFISLLLSWNNFSLHSIE